MADIKTRDAVKGTIKTMFIVERLLMAEEHEKR